MIESLSLTLLNRGLYGRPSTDDVFNITEGMTTYQHSITARGGCESATINIDVPLENAMQYLDCILRHVRVYDQYAQQIWSGFVNRVTVDYGSSTTSIGLESFCVTVYHVSKQRSDCHTV